MTSNVRMFGTRLRGQLVRGNDAPTCGSVPVDGPGR